MAESSTTTQSAYDPIETLKGYASAALAGCIVFVVTASAYYAIEHRYPTGSAMTAIFYASAVGGPLGCALLVMLPLAFRADVRSFETTLPRMLVDFAVFVVIWLNLELLGFLTTVVPPEGLMAAILHQFRTTARLGVLAAFLGAAAANLLPGNVVARVAASPLTETRAVSKRRAISRRRDRRHFSSGGRFAYEVPILLLALAYGLAGAFLAVAGAPPTSLYLGTVGLCLLAAVLRIAQRSEE